MDAHKIVIAGGFGVGKTTLVRAVSEITPLVTEETLTTASSGVDHVTGAEPKTTTTVALDFGRITFADQQIRLYLFGTPGQERFWFMWEDLTKGAVGAVILVDTRRLDSSFAAVEYFEHTGTPFVVAVNTFDGAPAYPLDAVREALNIATHIPILTCDARRRTSVIRVLGTVVEQALAIPTTHR